jgi:hypothetical protein
VLPKDIADSPAALIALAGQHDSDGLLGQFKRGAQNFHLLQILALIQNITSIEREDYRSIYSDI